MSSAVRAAACLLLFVCGAPATAQLSFVGDVTGPGPYGVRGNYDRSVQEVAIYAAHHRQFRLAEALYRLLPESERYTAWRELAQARIAAGDAAVARQMAGNEPDPLQKAAAYGWLGVDAARHESDLEARLYFAMATSAAGSINDRGSKSVAFVVLIQGELDAGRRDLARATLRMYSITCDLTVLQDWPAVAQLAAFQADCDEIDEAWKTVRRIPAGHWPVEDTSGLGGGPVTRLQIRAAYPRVFIGQAIARAGRWPEIWAIYEQFATSREKEEALNSWADYAVGEPRGKKSADHVADLFRAAELLPPGYRYSAFLQLLVKLFKARSPLAPIYFRSHCQGLTTVETLRFHLDLATQLHWAGERVLAVAGFHAVERAIRRLRGEDRVALTVGLASTLTWAGEMKLAHRWRLAALADLKSQPASKAKINRMLQIVYELRQTGEMATARSACLYLLEETSANPDLPSRSDLSGLTTDLIEQDQVSEARQLLEFARRRSPPAVVWAGTKPEADELQAAMEYQLSHRTTQTSVQTGAASAEQAALVLLDQERATALRWIVEGYLARNRPDLALGTMVRTFPFPDGDKARLTPFLKR